MNTIDFIRALADWLLADPTHLVAAASGLAAAIPTPAAGSLGAKLFKILDILAINIIHAKETGEPGSAASTTAPQPQGLKPLGALLLCLALGMASACTSTGQLTPQAQQIITVACNVDALAQPVAQTIAPELAPELTPVTTIDAALVHPAVVQACKAVNGTPSSVTVTPAAAAPVTAPIAASPAPAVVPAAPAASAGGA